MADSAPGGPEDAGVLRRYIDKRLLAPPSGVSTPHLVGQHPEEAYKSARAFTLEAAHRLILKRLLSMILLLVRGRNRREGCLRERKVGGRVEGICCW